jgi:hypothetical protein
LVTGAGAVVGHAESAVDWAGNAVAGGAERRYAGKAVVG